jgi:secreted trypsin-like serine protease
MNVFGQKSSSFTSVQSIKGMTFTLAMLSLSFSAHAGVNIIGGELVQAGDEIEKTTAGLYIESADGGGSICTGTILNDTTIVTAAHCIEGGYKYAVAVFALNFDNPTKESMRKIVSSKIIAKLGDRPANQEQLDIAMVKFAGGLPAGYRAAKTLSLADARDALSKASEIVLAGYGVTKHTPEDALAQASGLPQSGPDTSGTLRKVTVKVQAVGQVSALVGIPNQGACHGDSGGPAYVKYNGETYAVGVTSRGIAADGSCDGNAIYTILGVKPATRVAATPNAPVSTRLLASNSRNPKKKAKKTSRLIHEFAAN